MGRMRTAKTAALLTVALVTMLACTSSQAAKAPAAKVTPDTYTYNPGASTGSVMHPHVAAPKSLAATATGPNSVHLSWVAPSTLTGGYWLTSSPSAVDEELAVGATAADVGGLQTNTTYSFSLQAVGTDQMSLAVVVSVTTELPTSNVIAGVPQYYQLPLSCEETATSMALMNQGLNISTKQILAALGVDSTPIVIRGGRIVSWGNPDKAFVGNVYGSENHAPWGYQSNPKALVRVLNSFGATIIDWSEPGVTANTISAQEIYTQVLSGHPVVAYATWDWKYHAPYYYTSEDGNKVATIYPWDDHVYAVVGVNATSVLVHDPIRGTYWVSKASFEAAYEFGMAIVLK